MLRAVCVGLTCMWLTAGPTMAQDNGEEIPLDMGTYRCSDHLEVIEADDGRAELLTLWAHGYYSGRHGLDEKSAPLTSAMLERFAKTLTAACRKEPPKLFVAVLKEME